MTAHPTACCSCDELLLIVRFNSRHSVARHGMKRRASVSLRGEQRSGTIADASPECESVNPVVAGAAAATLPGVGEVMTSVAAKVIRVGMASNGCPGDRGRPCIVFDPGLYRPIEGAEKTERRIHKSEAMRCKESERPIVAMKLCESTEEVRVQGKCTSGPEPKARGLRRGRGNGWNRKRDAGNTGWIPRPEGRYEISRRMPLAIANEIL